MRDIHILATEISATVGELKEFCEEHYDILSDAKDMSVALLDLIMCVLSDLCYSIATHLNVSGI